MAWRDVGWDRAALSSAVLAAARLIAGLDVARHWVQCHVRSRNESVVRGQTEIYGERNDGVQRLVAHVPQPAVRRTFARVHAAQHVEGVLTGARVLDVTTGVKHPDAKLLRNGIRHLGNCFLMFVRCSELGRSQKIALHRITRETTKQRDEVMQTRRTS